MLGAVREYKRDAITRRDTQGPESLGGGLDERVEPVVGRRRPEKIQGDVL